jgi:hypothetical protein
MEKFPIHFCVVYVLCTEILDNGLAASNPGRKENS